MHARRQRRWRDKTTYHIVWCWRNAEDNTLYHPTAWVQLPLAVDHHLLTNSIPLIHQDTSNMQSQPGIEIITANSIVFFFFFLLPTNTEISFMSYCDRTHTASGEQDRNRADRLRQFVNKSQQNEIIWVDLMPGWQVGRNRKLSNSFFTFCMV